MSAKIVFPSALVLTALSLCVARGQTPPPAAGVATPVNFGTDVPGVTMRELNETFFNLGGGRDWWIWGSANSCDGPLWRLGFDVGGRYGSGRVRLWELRHRTDVMGGVW